MSSNSLVDRATGILLRPRTEWPAIAAEADSIGGLYTRYIVIMAAIPPVMGFFKTAVIGVGFGFGSFRVGIGAGLTAMILHYVLSLVGVFVMSLIVDALAPGFGGQKNQVQALKTVAYSYTASWVASIGVILPWIYLLILLFGAGYGIYLVYLGLPNTMKCPPEKSAGYTAVSIIVAILLYWVIGMIVSHTVGFGAMMSGARAAEYGHRNLDSRDTDRGEVTFDKDSALGKLADMGKRAQEAQAQMEAARKSGDSKAEANAAGAMLAAALGGDSKIEPIAPERLKAFVPDSIGGFKRTEISSEKSGALGMQTSNAKGSYSDGAGHSLQLEVGDLGGAKGMLALAGFAVGTESDKQTDHGFDKTYKSGDQWVHEQWDARSKSGEYSQVIADRFVVTVRGEANGIEDLKATARNLDLSALASLKDEGAKKN